VCAALAQIAKHSVELAETVVEAEIFPKILSCLKDTDIQVTPPPPTVARNAHCLGVPAFALTHSKL
jgi:hypothetical protein